MSENEFDPSLHVLPLEPKTNTPVLLLGEEGGGVFGITTDGRISFFPVESETVLLGKERTGKIIPLLTKIQERIDTRFPKNKDIYGNSVRQFVVAAVMYGEEGKSAVFIFEVWGFSEIWKELEVLYENLLSLGGCKVGDERYNAVQQLFYSEPVKVWINNLIGFLKQQLDWSNYVRKRIDLTLEQK